MFGLKRKKVVDNVFKSLVFDISHMIDQDSRLMLRSILFFKKVLPSISGRLDLWGKVMCSHLQSGFYTVKKRYNYLACS